MDEGDVPAEGSLGVMDVTISASGAAPPSGVLPLLQLMGTRPFEERVRGPCARGSPR